MSSMVTPWDAVDDLAAVAQQLHDERCIFWGCLGTPHTLDWLMARRMLRGGDDG